MIPKIQFDKKVVPPPRIATTRFGVSKLAVAWLILGVMLMPGCATTTEPTALADPKVAATMTLGEAKETIERGFLWSFGTPDSNPEVAIEFGSDRYCGYNRYSDGRLVKGCGCPLEKLQPTVFMEPVSINDGKRNGYKVLLTCSWGWHQVFLPTLNDAKKVAAAMLRYSNSTQRERQDWDVLQQQEFNMVAAKYRAENPKPVMDENQHRASIMATTAVRENRFSDAVIIYEDALKQAPWWPGGHFNVALLLRSLNYYNEAIDHMQKYLALVPNAQDARAAQDKIYEWQSEMQGAQQK